MGDDAAVSTTYAAATTVEEALGAMRSGSRPIAGGTDLVVGARQGKAPLPDALIAIHGLAELHGIEAPAGGGLRIGALTSHADLVDHSAVRERFTAIADASAVVGSHATRHVGTLGGNVMNASPAMETGGPLMCLGAVAVLASAGGERRLALEQLLTGPGRTAASPDELLVAIELPAPAAASGSCYARLEYRRQMEIAVVGATCSITLDGSRVAAARVAITALTPSIVRVPEAEAALTGSDGGPDAVRAAGDAAAAAGRPISDVRASAEYRRAMAAVIARRAIAAALARARGGSETVPIPASPALHGATDEV
jgi:CO/xanthine dehydrogenase FAD-binding subunit